MKMSGFLLLVAMFLFGGCLLQKRQDAPNLIAEASTEPSPELFATPMRAAFLLDVNGEALELSGPEFEFQTDRAYLTPSAKNVVFFRAGDVTWGEFFGTLGVKIENNCITLKEEATCAGEGEKLEVVLNSEAMAYDPAWLMRSGDRLFVGIEKESVSKQALATIPDPWTVEDE